MLESKGFITFLMVLSITMLFSIIYPAEAVSRENNLKFVQAESYRRVFPESVSPKPDTIQSRDAREEMEAEAQKEKAVSEAEPKESVPKGKPALITGEPSKIQYQISVNDRLYIGVWRVPDLSIEVIVGPDGKISFPLIGDIDAAGKTLSELDAEITEKLKEYVNNPQVSVVVREFAGDRVTVLGEVADPGIYKFSGRTRLMDIIALANGFTDEAKTASIVIVREPSEPVKDADLIVVNMKEILKGDLKYNIEIQPYDIIYVSRTFISNVKEFYDNWLTPVLNTMIDYETYKSVRRGRHR